MAGGASTSDGLTYQKDFAAYVLLTSEALRLLSGIAAEKAIRRFAIEARDDTGGTVWDVEWETEDDCFELRECKDTKISKTDRKTFYRRIRRRIVEIGSVEKVTFGWVTDKEKQDGLLPYLEWARDNAEHDFGDSQYKFGNLTNGERALREALYYLCEEPAGFDEEANKTVNNGEPLSDKDARILIARLKIDCYRSSDLATSVEQLAEGLFENGCGTKIRRFIQGEFDAAIQRDGEANYSRSQFLGEVRDSEISSIFTSEFKKIVQFNNGANLPFDNSNIVTWSSLENQPTTVWSIDDRLETFDPTKSCVIVGRTGVGKTTSLLQIAEIQVNAVGSFHVLHFDCSQTTGEILEAIPLLVSVLASVSTTWIGLDGLDQIKRYGDERWKLLFRRLQSVPNIILSTTVRAEVIEVHDWMQATAASLGEITLNPLSGDQIDIAFKDVGLSPPRNQSLRKCLEIPFLFDIYAQTACEEDTSLENAGEVEAFDLIGRFWQKRIKNESVGLRLVGEAATSPDRKQKGLVHCCLLYTSPSPRDRQKSRMPSSA